MSNYTVTLDDGSDIVIEADSVLEALQNAREIALKPAYAEELEVPIVETIFAGDLYTLTNGTEILAHVEKLAKQACPNADGANILAFSLGTLAEVLATQNKRA